MNPKEIDMNHSMIRLTTILAFAATSWLAQAQSSMLPASLAPSARADRQPSGEAVAAASTLPWRQLEGLWDEQVEQVDCHSGVPLHPIGRGTNLFMAGGALIATNNAPPTVMGVTLGQWWYGRDHKFHAKMRLNLFQPPLETFLGIREMERDITLSNHGNNLAGTVLVQDYFADGSPNGSPFCSRETGTRISVP